MTKNSVAAKELEAKKAESWQGLKAFLIPLTLFLACVCSAAGVFLVQHHEPLGWGFLLVSGVTIILDFVGLIRFQNQWRVKGMIANNDKDE
jgi:hypothetical protein